MSRRLVALVLGLALVAVVPQASVGAPATTVVRTIQDTDGDNRLEYAPGEDYVVVGADEDFRPPRRGSILNFLHMTDFQLVDEESPGRVEFLDTTQRGPFSPFSSAYRPQEALTLHVTEAMVRAARNTVSPITSERLELTMVTGDNLDSQQFNETRWFIDILDGTTGHRSGGRDGVAPATKIDPDSGDPDEACDADPDAEFDDGDYDGVQGGGPTGYYDPDASDGEDGDGYSPNREENLSETGRDVTVRDFPGLFESAQEPFEALGLDMTWYSAVGNHDVLVQGNSPEAYAGPFGPGPEASNPTFQEIATGCLKVTGATNPSDPSFFPAGPTRLVPPDQERCYVSKDESAPLGGGAPPPCNSGGYIDQHFITTGEPVGHGFALSPCPGEDESCAGYGRPPSAVSFSDGYYSFSPREGLRFVMLDTNTDECGSPFCSEGSVDDAQFRWLESQIDTAQAMGQYVVMFTHHTFETTRFPSADATEQPLHYGRRVDREDPSNPQGISLGETLEELYCRSDNVLAQVSGHQHRNDIERYECAEDQPPTPGTNDFWHITTAAHIDWPQQARMIELVDNSNGTMSMVLTMLDHAGPPNPGGAPAGKSGAGNSGQQVLQLASIARELAYNDYQGNRGARGERSDRNVILVLDKPWPHSP